MIKGVLFDKDGTMIKFDSLWKKASYLVVEQILEKYKMKASVETRDCILQAIGIVDGQITEDSPIAYMTYADIGKEISRALRRKEIFVAEDSLEYNLPLFYDDVLQKGEVICELICDFHGVAKKLHDQKIKIGLATADKAFAVKKSFEKLGIMQDFDFFGWDDGEMLPKPSKDMFCRFQKRFSFQPHEILVVGDTVNDVRFAHAGGGIAVGVLSGLGKKKDFQGKSDFLLSSIEELPELVAEINNVEWSENKIYVSN